MKKILIGLATAILIVGCSGGGGVPVDNSDNLENQYGFFGGDTKFQGYNIVGDWTYYKEGADSIYARYREDGSGTQRNISFIYGVNKSGTQITYNTGSVITYLGTKKDYLHIYSNGVLMETLDCYDVTVNDSGTIYNDIVFCPD